MLYNLGNLHIDNGRPDLAEAELNEALTIRRILADKYPEAYRPDLAASISILCILYAITRRKELALVTLEEALGICKKLAESFPEAFQLYYQKCLETQEFIRNQ